MASERIRLSARHREVSRLRDGTLGTTPFGLLLFAFSVHERTLAIEIRRTHIKKTILMDEGIPFECHSNLLHETFAAFLVRRDLLSDFQAKEYLAEAAEREIRLGEVLMEKSLLDPVGLYRALQQNLAQKLLECFTWTNGEFRILPDLPGASSSMSINVPQLVFTGITKFAPREQVEAEVGHLLQQGLVVQHRPPVPLDALKLTSTQERLAGELLRWIEVGDARGSRLADDDNARRILHALSTLGIVAPAADTAPEALATRDPRGDSEDEEWTSEPVSVPVTVTAKTSERLAILAVGHERMPEDEDPLDSVFETLWVEEPIEVEVEIELPPDPPSESVSASDARQAPEAARDQRRLCNEIMADYLIFGDKDPFDLLGVTPEAPRTEIRARYVELCDKYAPWRFEAPQLHALSEKADELLRAVILAFADLTDDKRRRELVSRRETTAPKRGRILPASHFAAGTEELADTYRQRGQELMAIGNFAAASDLFALAADSDPENPASAVDLLYTQGRQSRAHAERSLHELETILERNPTCIQGCFHAAEIAHSLGDLDRAQGHFLRGCRLWAAAKERT